MEAGDGGESRGLEYTPTWIVAGVSFLIILISLCVQRALYRLGKILKHKKQDALYKALEKLKEACYPAKLIKAQRHLHLLQCTSSPIMKIAPEGIFCLQAQTRTPVHPKKNQSQSFSTLPEDASSEMQIQQWKHWEKSIQRAGEKTPSMHKEETLQHEILFMRRAGVYWRKAAVVSWTIAFCKQFYDSVTKSDYIALRRGFIQKHCPLYPSFDFHKYMSRAVDADFKKIVGISAFLWMFTIVFLLLNVEGWHTYFWLSFLPLILLLLVGAKLEHIIIRLAQETRTDKADRESAEVKPSDDHFWFGKPVIVLHLIHFILFQNSFEIAFFFWIWCTYGFHSCIMEKFGYIIPRLMIGALVQVLCSYSTLPLYALVAQMGSSFNKDGMFEDHMQASFSNWVNVIRGRGGGDDDRPSRSEASTQPRDHKLVTELNEISQDSESCSVHLHSIRDSPVP
ncbi:hypothetical protein SAY87_017791 [Trapa incisa]|uniref:MLO-like protein n=1 Tax=Trapa incisa TaxID=236973 RepID=A0AAN7QS70_9MYRT|nr:hypothetical protein SAY87_017791 [Trapa incisa]